MVRTVVGMRHDGGGAPVATRNAPAGSCCATSRTARSLLRLLHRRARVRLPVGRLDVATGLGGAVRAAAGLALGHETTSFPGQVCLLSSRNCTTLYPHVVVPKCPHHYMWYGTYVQSDAEAGSVDEAGALVVGVMVHLTACRGGGMGARPGEYAVLDTRNGLPYHLVVAVSLGRGHGQASEAPVGGEGR